MKPGKPVRKKPLPLEQKRVELAIVGEKEWLQQNNPQTRIIPIKRTLKKGRRKPVGVLINVVPNSKAIPMIKGGKKRRLGKEKKQVMRKGLKNGF